MENHYILQMNIDSFKLPKMGSIKIDKMEKQGYPHLPAILVQFGRRPFEASLKRSHCFWNYTQMYC